MAPFVLVALGSLSFVGTAVGRADSYAVVERLHCCTGLVITYGAVDSVMHSFCCLGWLAVVQSSWGLVAMGQQELVTVLGPHSKQDAGHCGEKAWCIAHPCGFLGELRNLTHFPGFP